jgi:hypothetical protein
LELAVIVGGALVGLALVTDRILFLNEPRRHSRRHGRHDVADGVITSQT